MPDAAMLSRPIPSTGESMPVIGLGTWAVCSMSTPAPTLRGARIGCVSRRWSRCGQISAFTAAPQSAGCF
jgi:hypothetical protein